MKIIFLNIAILFLAFNIGFANTNNTVVTETTEGEVTLNLPPTPPPPITITHYLCTPGQTINICAQTSGSAYSWIIGGQTTSCISVNQTTTQYICNITTSTGIVTEYHVIKNFDAPELVFDYCGGQSKLYAADDNYRTTLQNTAYTAYKWIESSNPSTIISTAYYTTVTPNKTYTVIVTNGQCAVSYSKTLGNIITAPSTISTTLNINATAGIRPILLVNNDVTITTTGSVTLTDCDVYIAPYKKVIIKENNAAHGTFSATGSVFDGQCNISNQNKNWGPIMIDGSDFQENNISYSDLYITNCTLKNALRAVYVHKSLHFDISTSSFINNYESIYCDSLNSNSYAPPKISDNIFEVNNYALYDYQLHRYQITLKNYYRIFNIYSNIITKTNTINPNLLLNGICFYNSIVGSITKNVLSSDPVRPSFHTLNEAIKITNSQASYYPFTISYCDFYKGNAAITINDASHYVIKECIFHENKKGILLDNTNTPLIYNNTFDENSIREVGNYQIMLRGCNNPTVQYNHHSNGTAGIVVENCTGNYQLYRNTFAGFSSATPIGTGYPAGIISQGVNGDYGTTSGTGLAVKCNQFNTSNYAIALMTGHMKRYQGSATNFISAPANNEFLGTSYLSKGQLFISNEAQYYYPVPPGGPIGPNLTYNYYYPKYPLTGNTAKLTNFTTLFPDGSWGNWTTQIANNIPNTFQYDVFCPDNVAAKSSIISDGTENITMSELSNTIDDLNNQINIRRQNLQSKVDNGNTPLLISNIENAAADDYSEVVEEINNTDAYISDQAALEFMQKEVNRPIAKTSALIANSPLPELAKIEIDKMNIPENLKNLLKTHQNGTSIREIEELEIANLQATKNTIFQKALHNVLADSVLTGLDSLLYLIGSQDEWNCKSQALNMYVSRGKTSEAESKILEMRQNAANFDQEKQAHMNHYLDLMNLCINLRNQADNSRIAMINQNSTWLSELADGNYADGKAMANTLLKEAGLREYKDIVYLPSPSNENKNAILNPAQFNSNYDFSKADNMIDIYPNPVNNQLSVEFAVFTGNVNSFGVYDINGRLLKTHQLSTEKNIGMEQIDVTDLPNGIYILSFGTSGIDKYSKQFIINR